MQPLIEPEFHNVVVIKTRPGVRPNPAMIDGLCWNCATENGCDGLRKNCDNGSHYDLFTCPRCRRMVPWSSGGTDSLDCADCWALTEERKTMEEKQAEQPDENITVDVPGTINDRGIVLSQTKEDAAKIRELQEPGRPISSLAVGTIRGSKLKSNTKALEKIIKRQEKRILELARENGNLASVIKGWEPLSERLLSATDSKGASEAIAKVEKWAELCIPAQPKYYPSASATPSAEHCPVPVTDLAG